MIPTIEEMREEIIRETDGMADDEIIEWYKAKLAGLLAEILCEYVIEKYNKGELCDILS